VQNPTFYVEGVIQGRDTLEDFEGPLTLLLHLLSKNKVEIADIRIGDICDQYVAHLDQMAKMDLDVASEFVQMASHLVYIKARTLLYEEAEIPELEQLISSMESLQRKAQYTQIKGVVEALAIQYAAGSGYTEKPPEYISNEHAYRYRHHVIDLLEALGRIFERGFEQIAPDGTTFHIPTPITYSVTAKAREIIARLRRVGEMSIRTLFFEAKSRSEVVATFVAMLELCKLGSIRFQGEGADLTIEFTGIEVDEAELETQLEVDELGDS